MCVEGNIIKGDMGFNLVKQDNCSKEFTAKLDSYCLQLSDTDAADKRGSLTDSDI